MCDNGRQHHGQRCCYDVTPRPTQSIFSNTSFENLSGVKITTSQVIVWDNCCCKRKREKVREHFISRRQIVMHDVNRITLFAFYLIITRHASQLKSRFGNKTIYVMLQVMQWSLVFRVNVLYKAITLLVISVTLSRLTLLRLELCKCI